MKLNLTILTLLFISICPLLGQTLTKIESVPLSEEVVHASTDRQGNLYIASRNGDVDRFDKDGQLAYHFSPDKKGEATFIEAWQGLRTFIFYRDFQQYLFLDRFLNSNGLRFDVANDLSRYYQLATVAGDNNLWLIDQQEIALKKLDIRLNEFLLESSFTLNLNPDNFELTFIREYQNLLFISDKQSGILVFDNLGNYLQTLPIQGLQHFSFSKNELLGIHKKGALTLIDIYTKKEREISLPDPSYQFVFMENSRLYCITDRRIDIYTID